MIVMETTNSNSIDNRITKSKHVLDIQDRISRLAFRRNEGGSWVVSDPSSLEFTLAYPSWDFGVKRDFSVMEFCWDIVSWSSSNKERGSDVDSNKSEVRFCSCGAD